MWKLISVDVRLFYAHWKQLAAPMSETVNNNISITFKAKSQTTPVHFLSELYLI